MTHSAGQSLYLGVVRLISWVDFAVFLIILRCIHLYTEYDDI